MDVKGVSFSNAISMDVQVVSLFIVSSKDVHCAGCFQRHQHVSSNIIFELPYTCIYEKNALCV
jgi:hypothetical protein